MSYSDEWFLNIQHRRGIERRWPKAEPAERPKPVEPVPVESTTWRPWAEMTAEERRKAISEREHATPGKAPR